MWSFSDSNGMWLTAHITPNDEPCRNRFQTWGTNAMYKHQCNILRPRRNWYNFAEIYKCIFLNKNVFFLKLAQKSVPKGTFNNIPALVQIIAWQRPDDKSSSKPIMVSLPTHISVTRPPWYGCNVSNFGVFEKKFWFRDTGVQFIPVSCPQIEESFPYLITYILQV